MVALFLALMGPANAQATLLEGDTLLQNCLGGAVCGEALTRLLSENMAEYGFVLQADPVATSVLGGKGMGVVAELRVDTLTFGPKNDIEQLVLIPPGLPRISVGYQYGSYTYDDPYPQAAVGLTVLPPLRVLGGTLVGVQVDSGVALPLIPALWVGVEGALGYGQLAVPLLGTESQLSEIPVIQDNLTLGGSACTSIGRGCLDRFWQTNAQARVGVSVEPIPAAFAYARGAWVAGAQRLDVAYDDTLWGQSTSSVQAQFGGGVRAGDKYQLALGGVVASRPEIASTAGKQPLVKALFSTSFRFGDARYWERKEASN